MTLCCHNGRGAYEVLIHYTELNKAGQDPISPSGLCMGAFTGESKISKEDSKVLIAANEKSIGLIKSDFILFYGHLWLVHLHHCGGIVKELFCLGSDSVIVENLGVIPVRIPSPQLPYLQEGKPFFARWTRNLDLLDKPNPYCSQEEQ